MNDEKLVKLIKADPNTGMGALMDRYTGYVAAVVRARLGEICDSSEIEDCIVDVFIEFQRTIGRYELRASVKNYLCVIARNIAADYYKRKTPALSLDDENLFIEIADDADVAEETVKKELIRSILKDISKMDEPDRTILFKKYFLGQSAKAIAKETHCSVPDVYTRAHRAMAKLKEKYRGRDGT